MSYTAGITHSEVYNCDLNCNPETLNKFAVTSWISNGTLTLVLVADSGATSAKAAIFSRSDAQQRETVKQHFASTVKQILTMPAMSRPFVVRRKSSAKHKHTAEWIKENSPSLDSRRNYAKMRSNCANSYSHIQYTKMVIDTSKCRLNEWRSKKVQNELEWRKYFVRPAF